MKPPAFRLPQFDRSKLIGPFAFLAAGLLALLVAWGAAVLIERLSVSSVTSRLLAEGVTWATVRADGLQLHLIGTAPNEAARYRVVNIVGSEVESSRVRDKLGVTPAKANAAPAFSLEMLRNDDGIQLIGLLPDGEAEAALTQTARALMPDIPLSDMIETAAYPAPQGWQAALDYGVAALQLLPRSKISIAADRVAITAIAVSEAEKRALVTQLNTAKPPGLNVVIDISAPRPVLTPFTLRFVKDATSARFDACSADTDAARARILAAATAAGVEGRSTCVVGLGVPSPSWSSATSVGIAAVAELANATITFKDADVSLQAGSEVSQADFDRVVGELEAALPEVFSLNATLEKKAAAGNEGPAEFTAVLAPETGKLELRGRLTDERLRAAVDSFARAEFGSANVYLATRIDAELPDGWPARVLAGLQAMAQLEHGKLLVTAQTVEITGITGSTSGKSRISQILSDKLGQGKTFKVDVSYDQELDPLAALPTPSECAGFVDDALARGKITFTPGSAEIDREAGAVMTALADALSDCPGIMMEIAGYTDAQGSEEGNRALSQARAEAVLVALQGRQVDVTGMVAKGYGEANPLADNKTESGREANRRIEITLVGGDKPSGARARPYVIDAVPFGDEGGPGGAGAAPASGAAPDGRASDPAPNDASAKPASPAVPEPDFSGDQSPSVAPKDITLRPKPRAATSG